MPHTHPTARRLGGFVAALAALLAAPAWADCALQQVELPVRMVGQRPVATIEVNGTTVPMLVDSGAFYSVLLPSTASQLKLPLRPLPANFSVEGYTGRIDMMRTVVEKVGLLGLELPNIEFLVGGNELGAGIMGILGRNVLAVADTEYDLGQGMVRLSFPKGEGCRDTNFAHWAGNAPVVEVPLEEAPRGETPARQTLGIVGLNPPSRTDSAARVKVDINGIPLLALLDTGATRTSMTARAAAKAGIEDSALVPAGRTGGAGANLVQSWVAPVRTFNLGGEKMADVQLRVNQTTRLPEGMLLGVDYFLTHRIYVSRLQRRVYITWNGTPVFPQKTTAAP